MKDKYNLFDEIKKILLYGGLGKEEFEQVESPIAEANHKALKHWPVIVSIFWIYCLVMSLKAADYARCRAAYFFGLLTAVFSYLFARFTVTKFPKTLSLFKFIFRLSLLGGGIGIAMCQPDVRSLTLFAVAIISPSIFIDSTLASATAHFTALIFYIILGKNVITPDIYSWGLGNYILFSIFGFFIGNAINRDRYERFLYAVYEKKFSEMQMRYANFDQLTGLRNRHAFEDMLTQMTENPPDEFCVLMADINGLKYTNDTIGHNAGDELITGASECLSTGFEGIDTIYRIGGDEFCIIMPGPIENAEPRLARLNELIDKWHGKYIDSVSVSIGVASNKNHDDIESVIIEADRNMYKCKRDYYMSRGIDRMYH